MIIKEIMSLVAANMSKVEARIGQIEERIPLETRHVVRDPYQNPFLIFDPVASAAAGKPIFANVARSPALDVSAPATTAPVTSELIPQWAYEKVPEIRARFTRDIPSPFGDLSPEDLARLGEKQPNYMLWAAGGVIAAVAATQMM